MKVVYKVMICLEYYLLYVRIDLLCVCVGEGGGC
jgi:hypothetical protein